MNGTKLPAEIAKLGEEKEITLFVDGDRGGKLIGHNVIKNAKIMYVAVAPDGKEVEELTGKEILMALRKRIPAKEFISRETSFGSYEIKDSEVSAQVQTPTFDIAPEKAKAIVKSAYEKIKGSKTAILLDGNGDIIQKVSSRDASRALISYRKPVFAVVVDGSAVSAIVRACDERGVAYLGATTFSTDGQNVKLISL
jgi:DNA primase